MEMVLLKIMNNKKKKILITGAEGFIGSHLSAALIKKGYHVLDLVYGDHTRPKGIKNKNLKIIKGDVTNFKLILEIFKKYKPETVFHMAAVLPLAGEEDPFLYFDVNTKGTLNILEACRKADVRNIIYSSSMSVYGKDIRYLPVDERHPVNPNTFYGLTKWQGEEFGRIYASNYKLNIINLRYSGVYGPDKGRGAVVRFMKNAFSGKPLKILENTSWDIVYVDDVVRANISALEKIDKLRFETINIGSGEETNIENLAKKIKEITKSASLIKINKSLPKSRFFYDISKAKKLLDFRPLSIRQGLLAYANNFRKNILK
jgi:UDP-glucose 4-epimerase